MIWTPRLWLPERPSEARQRLRRYQRARARRGMLGVPCCCGACQVCEEDHTLEWEVTLAGIANDTCSACAANLNGTFTLTFKRCFVNQGPPEATVEEWEYFIGQFCTGSPAPDDCYLFVTLQVRSLGGIYVFVTALEDDTGEGNTCVPNGIIGRWQDTAVFGGSPFFDCESVVSQSLPFDFEGTILCDTESSTCSVTAL